MKMVSLRVHNQKKVRHKEPTTRNPKSSSNPKRPQASATVSCVNYNGIKVNNYIQSQKVKTFKVSENNYKVPCKNRFSTLYLGDEIVSQVTDSFRADNPPSLPLRKKNPDSSQKPLNVSQKIGMRQQMILWVREGVLSLTPKINWLLKLRSQ